MPTRGSWRCCTAQSFGGQPAVRQSKLDALRRLVECRGQDGADAESSLGEEQAVALQQWLATEIDGGNNV